jgi:hypothetical protein
MVSPGLGVDGAMAEYMVVDTVRHLVPIATSTRSALPP